MLWAAMVAGDATLSVSVAAPTCVACDVPRGTTYVASTWNMYKFHLEPTYNTPLQKY